MRLLSGEKWGDGHLDGARGADEYRIRVAALQNLEPLEGMYFVRERSLRTLWNYLREIGPLDTARKVISRSREKGRNAKAISCGLGWIDAAPQAGRFAAGQWVAFLLPLGPLCAERVVLPESLIALTSVHPEIPDGELWYRDRHNESTEEPWWGPARGHTRDSGEVLASVAAEIWLKESIELLRRADWPAARRLAVGNAPGCETRPARVRRSDKPRAVLFGFGNYAKTTILPHVAAGVSVDRIHEIDPSQMHLPNRDVVWDTSPVPRADDDHDAFLIAGYHHTHAPIACEALRRGAAAVIEKPIATTQRQLQSLLAAMKQTDGVVFSCFQRRYMRFNEMARADLAMTPGDPVSYHCIVYEVPLPDRHWYRWPNSGSRLLSNGCHWIDHFLYLNDFCDPVAQDVFVAPDGTINCSVTLGNGAFFSMVLTDQGSERIGVQDHVELRTGSAVVRIDNGSRYRAERGAELLRQRRVNKIDAYRRMYSSIAQRIADGAAGDPLESVRVSTQLVLDLEARLHEVVRQATEMPTSERFAKVA